MGQTKKSGQRTGVVTLKVVAQHLGLTPGTVSVVLNNSPSARAIPRETKDRIHAAAKELDYRPNFFARTLRNKRTYTSGVIAEEIGDSYGSMVISGIEGYLRTRDYFFLTVVHRHNREVTEEQEFNQEEKRILDLLARGLCPRIPEPTTCRVSRSRNPQKHHISQASIVGS